MIGFCDSRWSIIQMSLVRTSNVWKDNKMYWKRDRMHVYFRHFLHVFLVLCGLFGKVEGSRIAKKPNMGRREKRMVLYIEKKLWYVYAFKKQRHRYCCFWRIRCRQVHYLQHREKRVVKCWLVLQRNTRYCGVSLTNNRIV